MAPRRKTSSKIVTYAPRGFSRGMLREHLRIVDQRMKGTLEQMGPEKERELIAAIASTKKWLKEVNAALKKQKKKPLTFEQALKQYREK